MGGCCGKKNSGGDNNGRNSNNLDPYSSSSRKLLRDENSIIHTIVDKDDFANQLSSAGDRLVVVDFYATWCRPCTMINPKVEAMATEFTDVLFLKVDVNDCEDITADYGVQSMPTFIFIKKSKKIEEFSGANEEKLREIIKGYR